ncbi:iron-containing redox enzyme family protein [Rubrivivax sp. RP6-9]|uniref:iron-containing redox enzyme family protein n=1 Tax=Rubrivivax sp. RP6-9 TaxID=3415750 RepID=UPI003CC51F88
MKKQPVPATHGLPRTRQRACRLPLQCMSLVSDPSVARAAAIPTAPRAGARRIYNALIGEHGVGLGAIDDVTRSASRVFLAAALSDAGRLDGDIPDHPRLLASWLDRDHQQTASAFRGYLDGRHAGEPRRLFRNRSHALHFIKSVAPTKLVDGAWLYGLLPHWNDARLAPLVRIYLEELGDGIAGQHHVLLYRKLLCAHGADRWHALSDAHHVQGALQLALGHHAAELLPEVIGFNLGYEQLPLHLPITAYELNELGVDPYYFSLHLTIDNASTGHARKSLQCALDCLPRAGDAADFYRRMTTGFKLNDIGMGTMEAIASFDLQRELTAVLADKGRIGALLHSDHCLIAGRSVYTWLSTPGGMPDFLGALVGAGWIRRGADRRESRFWRLLDDEGAAMFGVFDDYEKQLISDWIIDAPEDGSGANARRRPIVNRLHDREPARPGALPCGSEGSRLGEGDPGHTGELIRRQLAELSATERNDEDVRVVEQRLAGVEETALAVQALQGFLSPANHTTPAGLLAARICSGLIGQ